jgi:hypothetical protein
MAAGGGREWRWRGAASTKERKRGLVWLGSLLRTVSFGRGKREKSGGRTGGGGFTHLWKRKKDKRKRKKNKKEKEKKEKPKLDLLFYLFFIIIKLFKPYPRISVF